VRAVDRDAAHAFAPGVSRPQAGLRRSPAIGSFDPRRARVLRLARGPGSPHRQNDIVVRRHRWRRRDAIRRDAAWLRGPVTVWIRGGRYDHEGAPGRGWKVSADRGSEDPRSAPSAAARRGPPGLVARTRDRRLRRAGRTRGRSRPSSRGARSASGRRSREYRRRASASRAAVIPSRHEPERAVAQGEGVPPGGGAPRGVPDRSGSASRSSIARRTSPTSRPCFAPSAGDWTFRGCARRRASFSPMSPALNWSP